MFLLSFFLIVLLCQDYPYTVKALTPSLYLSTDQPIEQFKTLKPINSSDDSRLTQKEVGSYVVGSCVPWPLCDPSCSAMRLTAPPTFSAVFETDNPQGSFIMDFTRAWSPHAVDRMYV